MTDAFSQKAAKRQRAPKLKRDPVSGAFEGSTPLNDPDLLLDVVRCVKAIRQLQPVIAGMANDKDAPEGLCQSMQFTGMVLQSLGQTMLDALSAHSDLEVVSSLSKPVLTAPRRGGKA